MLSEAKLAMRITADAYDAEIAALLEAGAKDLAAVGVVLPGTVAFTVSDGVVTDTSTLVDKLAQRAIITYARMYFGSPEDFDRLAIAYRAQKDLLMKASDYTDYTDYVEEEEEVEADGEG